MTNEEAIKQLEWVKKRISEITYSPETFEAINMAIEALKNEPFLIDALHKAHAEIKEMERPHGEWIPITMRPIEAEEKIDYPDVTFMFDCPMPENGQDILVSTKYGVEYDTCYLDDGYYLDSDRDWEEVYAWQPLPEPYMREADNDRP